MQKPNGYEEVQAFRERDKITPGGHYCVIMGAKEMTSRTGKPMLQVCIDTTTDDPEPMFFTNDYRSRPAPKDGGQKKWPNDGTIYIMAEDSEGNCSSRLKGLVTAVEESNKTQAVWGDGFCSWLKGKKLGAVFGVEMDMYNGNVVEHHKINYFCSLEKVKDVKVPKPRETDEYKQFIGTAGPAVPDPDFMSIGGSMEDELPFM